MFSDDQGEARLPTALWVEAECAKLNVRGQGHYIAHRGNHASGVVMVKVYDITVRQCMLYAQQRDLDGALGWVRALGDDPMPEGQVDQYTQRAVSLDPDLWVVEVEAQSLDNPFDGRVFD